MRKVASACSALSKLTIRSCSIPKINMVLKSVEKANRAAKGVIRRRRTSADAIVHWMCQRGELLLFTLIFCLEFRQLMKMQTAGRRKKRLNFPTKMINLDWKLKLLELLLQSRFVKVQNSKEISSHAAQFPTDVTRISVLLHFLYRRAPRLARSVSFPS